ncbi:unnamed protein product [marine sediment metagenome]|uniref:Uncharacterized protein n=1 Tax=marine sediment metagenome TaxID=412755 RepID=X1KXA6_9ZZZZ
MSVPDLLTVARKLNNYAEDATAGGLWTDTTHYRVTVPTGKRWFLLGGNIDRDVSATIGTWVFDSAGNQIGILLSEAAETTVVAFPETVFEVPKFVLDAGEYIESFFGAAQSTAAFHSCIVLEVNA